MEKIYFDEETYIWKTKLNKSVDRTTHLKEAYHVIESQPETKDDGFAYKKEWDSDLDFVGDFKIKTKLDELVYAGINACKELYNERNIQYNKINTDAWVNVVRCKNPVQIELKYKEIEGVSKYHIHTELNKKFNSFIPHYTYVYYIQMPDVMNDDDGVLYFKGKNEKEYWIRPEEDDLIIMEADMPHAPQSALNSTIDRIVMAGNVGFTFIKKQKSLI